MIACHRGAILCYKTIYDMQTMGLPAATVSMLQGAILFFLLGGEILNRYRIRLRIGRGG